MIKKLSLGRVAVSAFDADFLYGSMPGVGAADGLGSPFGGAGGAAA